MLYFEDKIHSHIQDINSITNIPYSYQYDPKDFKCNFYWHLKSILINMFYMLLPYHIRYNLLVLFLYIYLKIHSSQNLLRIFKIITMPNLFNFELKYLKKSNSNNSQCKNIHQNNFYMLWNCNSNMML